MAGRLTQKLIIMQLSKKTKPELAYLFELPERVLQFGTGVFIRGLIDYFIDKANKEGNFNGRVVMVKSTDAGDINDFREQDCLYTLLMKSTGIEERVLCAGVSRVLDARDEWDSVLAARGGTPSGRRAARAASSGRTTVKSAISLSTRSRRASARSG